MGIPQWLRKTDIMSCVGVMSGKSQSYESDESLCTGDCRRPAASQLEEYRMEIRSHQLGSSMGPVVAEKCGIQGSGWRSSGG